MCACPPSLLLIPVAITALWEWCTWAHGRCGDNTRCEYTLWVHTVSTRSEYTLWVHAVSTRCEYAALSTQQKRQPFNHVPNYTLPLASIILRPVASNASTHQAQRIKLNASSSTHQAQRINASTWYFQWVRLLLQASALHNSVLLRPATHNTSWYFHWVWLSLQASAIGLDRHHAIALWQLL